MGTCWKVWVGPHVLADPRVSSSHLRGKTQAVFGKVNRVFFVFILSFGGKEAFMTR